ncbi:MAG: glycoside hydrolase family 3 C-terminal domain-containing protein [Muricoprocola sp.]
MEKWVRANYQPNLPLGENGLKVTACAEHLSLARKAAQEGMVLLKNENQVLPLKEDQKIAVFGKGLFDYVKGGGGSGDVTVSHVRGLYDGLKMRKTPARIYEPLADFYREEVERQYQQGAVPGMIVEPELPESLLEGAKEFTDTAIIVLSRFSGEGWDRKGVLYEDQNPDEAYQTKLSREIFENSDFYLTVKEQKLADTVCEAFEKVIVVLNVGGMTDTAWFAYNDKIDAALMAWQGGMEGGLAMADILFGDANPCGKLSDTFACDLEDYPSTANFHESENYVEYTEDIYVGYRYFETVEKAKEKVVYPFGYGLSYTTFAQQIIGVQEKEDVLYFTVKVENTGKVAGKEVIQVYYSAPQGVLGKPQKSLAVFAKTKELQPGENQVLLLSFPAAQMASYDDLGKIAKSAYILEKGDYHFWVGTSVRDGEMAEFVYQVKEDRITEQLSEKAAPSLLKKRMLADGSYEELPQKEPNDFMENGLGWSGKETEGLVPVARRREGYYLWPAPQNPPKTLKDVADGKVSLDEFMAQLTDTDLAELLGGQPNTGVANTFGIGNLPEYGVPNIMTADGPAGLRIEPRCEIYTTAWPCATMLACTWNTELVEKVAASAAKEVKENNISVWLAPAMNIHRSPLCGRNFEYYSEDPVVAGEMAAAAVKGIQSQGVAATVKHFACNNKETNRKNSDSRVSERALREIYLKGFEIAVKKAQPYALMTSYNLINEYRASENKDLLEGILRGEWGYQGVVMTDWWTKGEHYKETLAGNDVKMATGYPERLMMAVDKGILTRDDLEKCARKVLGLILKVD